MSTSRRTSMFSSARSASAHYFSRSYWSKSAQSALITVRSFCLRKYSSAAISAEAEVQRERELTEQFNSALTDLLVQGNFSALFLIYEDMLELGIPPNTETYNVLLRACFASSDLAGVKQFLTAMREEAVQFNPETVRHAIDYALKTQLTEELEAVLGSLAAGELPFNLRDVPGLSEREINGVLAILVFMRLKKLALYVSEERRSLPDGTTGASDDFAKLEDIVKRIPESTAIPKRASS